MSIVFFLSPQKGEKAKEFRNPLNRCKKSKYFYNGFKNEKQTNKSPVSHKANYRYTSQIRRQQFHL